MISGGYYIKARKIQESKIQRQPPYVREIWDWLLMNANHSDKKYNGFIIKRGQLFRTYKDIREGLAWYVGYRKEMYNENQTKKAMKALRDARMIDTTKELGGVLITILNYNKYQDPKNYESTNESTNESTTKEPMKNQPLPDNNKNEKNEKNERKNILPENKFSDATINFCDDAFVYLKNEHGNVFPKNPKIKDWYDCIDKLQRLDGFKIDEIRTALQWGVKDDFWSQQIISLASLRAKKGSDLTKFQKIYNASKNVRSSIKTLNMAEQRLNNNLQVGKEWLNEQ